MASLNKKKIPRKKIFMNMKKTYLVTSLVIYAAFGAKISPFLPTVAAAKQNPCYTCANNSSNPCTPDNVANNKLFFTRCDEPGMFVQCNVFGDCSEQSCSPGRKWNQQLEICTRPSAPQKTDKDIETRKHLQTKSKKKIKKRKTR
uniref:Chitin-binding type-2 domain-containing protein n=1 Tax=Ditylum brightwellii TaxID=49249 RepID=A0A7S2EW05_9STRA|mmetsp:Transcript_9461/g.14094  ORF Transcript_9461/g.14094 Transcript_9461/m.14094 type:complete len:145 (+) Transcript_9461:55-489(+)